MAEPPVPDPAPAQSLAKADGERHCIALVDDDRNILTTVSIALQAEGFDTRVYADGQTALKALLAGARVQGPLVHDARIAALCLQHGVKTLWTADRDFARFASLQALNPLIARA